MYFLYRDILLYSLRKSKRNIKMGKEWKWIEWIGYQFQKLPPSERRKKHCIIIYFYVILIKKNIYKSICLALKLDIYLDGISLLCLFYNWIDWLSSIETALHSCFFLFFYRKYNFPLVWYWKQTLFNEKLCWSRKIKQEY